MGAVRSSRVAAFVCGEGGEGRGSQGAGLGTWVVSQLPTRGRGYRRELSL